MKKKLGSYHYYSLPDLIGKNSRLPVSIRILLESLFRNCDGKRVLKEDVERLSKWNASKPDSKDIPFCVSRVILQDFTGVPLLADLAAMRDAVEHPEKIEPLVPVDLVIDHSVQVDRSGSKDAYALNLELEFKRNQERYEFLKWGQDAFETFRVVPPGIGIVHQVNLEYLASLVTEKDNCLYFDTLVGTDSHTTMINGLAILGWGVGGIEAEAAMLGQSVSIQTPEVVGVHITGRLPEGTTSTDLTLRVTELLRKEKVVGKFVEFFGNGARHLSVADRATIANMAPEYGATVGFFPADEQTLRYLEMTGRDPKHIALVKEYLEAQEMFGMPEKGQIDYTKVIELDLSTIQSSISGPKRPQDRIEIKHLKRVFQELFNRPVSEGGYGKKMEEYDKSVFLHALQEDTPHEAGGTEAPTEPDAIWSEKEMISNRPMTEPQLQPGYSDRIPSHTKLGHGSIVIAAITSCTNTSNPSVMIGAGLLAKKAVELGLRMPPYVKTSLAPGSRVVTDYLDKSGLTPYLNELGFQLVAYGCTTCIGNSGPLDPKIEDPIKEHDLIAVSVLSGNRNFEARIHGSVKANFLTSPPLVIAYALSGRIDIDLTREPIGVGKQGKPVFLKDIWPTSEEIQKTIAHSLNAELFQKRYSHLLTDNPQWQEIGAKKGVCYDWDPKSTYIKKPPFFELTEDSHLKDLRPLLLLGDSVTTDHISPAGAFKADTPAGKYLLENGIDEQDFNSYGSRRGNHEVMMRGTFANVRIQNKLAKGKEGGYTCYMPDETVMSIFDAAQKYRENNVGLIIFAGKDYGMGSSRDWAAKGPALLGVRAVVAESFERIHRSNLIGMGILPLLLPEGESWESLGITGKETFTLDVKGNLTVQQKIPLLFGSKKVQLTSCLDTPVEADYYLQGGILPYMLKKMSATS